jgi:hypothetical protein
MAVANSCSYFIACSNRHAVFSFRNRSFHAGAMLGFQCTWGFLVEVASEDSLGCLYSVRL